MAVILITGASSGIGRATAQAFLAAGWQVGLLARRGDALRVVAAGHDNALVLPTDVTNPGAVERAVAALADQFGRLDVLFNNAGIFVPQGMIDEIDPGDWAASLAVNLGGMFNAARAAFAQMRGQDPQGGRIINNGSISAHAPRPGSVCYTVTKHGVTGLTKSLSLDGRAYDIAAGQIDIGNARTPLLEDVAMGAKALGQEAPPIMEVADVARAVLHMASLPPGANIQTMTIMATKMAFVGRG
jgi:NADP-dependent 3-hydroxy acid dehydrogenase YdfG